LTVRDSKRPRVSSLRTASPLRCALCLRPRKPQQNLRGSSRLPPPLFPVLSVFALIPSSAANYPFGPPKKRGCNVLPRNCLVMWCLENRCQMAEFSRHQPMPAAQAEPTLEDALGGPKLEVGGTSGMEPLAHRVDSLGLWRLPPVACLDRSAAPTSNAPKWLTGMPKSVLTAPNLRSKPFTFFCRLCGMG
jgi:hypothetical protein